MLQVDVLVLAAGRGERLDGQPKAFLQLRGDTLLERIVGVGRQLGDSVIAAVPGEDLSRARSALGSTARVIAGGATRGETFRALLDAASAPTIVVLDVAHPLVDADLCRRVLAAAGEVRAAAAVTRPGDDAIAADGSTVSRNGELYLLSKPIVFQLEAIRRGAAFVTDGDGVLDMLRRAGTPIELVECEPWNVKLTTAADWQLVRMLADALAERAAPS